MKSRLSWFMAAGILVASFGLTSLMVSLKPEPERKPTPPRLPVAITVPAAVGADVIPVYGAGTVRPYAEIDVTAEIDGKVSWVNPDFRSGGRVRKGEALFRIDDAGYRNKVEQARADVAARRVAHLRATEDARIARAEYERFRSRQDGATSYPDASPLTLHEPQLQAAGAALAGAGAILADAELALSRTEVLAPFDGIVRSETVDTGQFVQAGRSVGRLYAADAVEVVVPLADSDAALVPGLWKLGTEDGNERVAARVIAEHGDGRYAWEGYVDRVEAALDEQTRTPDVIVRVPDPFAIGVPTGQDAGAPSTSSGSPPLLVGKFVEVEIQGRAPDRYYKVPAAALRAGNEVWAIRNGAITIIQVRVLQHTGDDVFVTGALTPGQAVVTAGIGVATEGMKVRTTSAGQP